MTYNRQFFETRNEELMSKIALLDKASLRYSILRFILFVPLFIPCVVMALMGKWIILTAILATIFLIAFIVVCVLQHSVSRKISIAKTTLEINQQYLARIEGDFSKLKDSGIEFYDEKHDYCLDLDVFGDTSLFALYNISESAFGRKAFADELKFAHVDERSNSKIVRRQKAIEELSESPEFLQNYQTIARLGKMKTMPSALIALAGQGKSFSKTHTMLYRLLPLLWLLPLISLFVIPEYAKAMCIPVLVINLIVWFTISSNYNSYFKAVDGISSQTQAVHTLFVELENSKLSNELTRELISGGEGADKSKTVSVGLKVLSRACKTAMLRSQPLIALIINAVFPFDLLCAEKLVSWSTKYGSAFEKSLASLAQIEAMMSASVVKLVSKNSCTPTFVDCDLASDKNAFFEGKDVVHPLLNSDKAVANSIKLSSQISLITGSNMSGKTTMIRTVGTSCILAYIGACVPATSLNLGRMRVMSSMRIVDSLEENMSTFRAELIRISGIVQASNDKKPLLFLIDEIFRGTNSADRTEGALTVLKRLSSSEICGLMTTHDYALCNSTLNVMHNIVYYHFSETYSDEGISFDYHLENGVSHSSNAKYLMKLVGIE